MMNTPLIGVTIFRTTTQSGLPAQSVTDAYIQALIQAGAAPLLIPLGTQDAALQAIVDRLDGVLFTGGGDVAVDLFNGKPHQRVGDVDTDRDRVEISLVQRVVQQKRPFLGICRGIQVINVALGGTLYTDIADQHPGALRHDWYPQIPRDYLAHTVEVSANSRLAGILGRTQVEVNSLHHQAVQQIAAGLTPTAYAPDGILESVELPEHPFGLGVQWHPEWLQAYEPMRALFGAFVHAARNSKV
jgi:putative glutamine amidotransferase